VKFATLLLWPPELREGVQGTLDLVADHAAADDPENDPQVLR
jgi:hypothetical protein